MPEKDRREQILAAARRCFIDNGFHPTRMDDIAKAANLSKGGVYFHFKSKMEVFECLVEEEFSSSMGFLSNVVVDANASISDKMNRLGQYYLEYFSSAPEAPRFFVVMGEMALRDTRLANRLLEMQTAYIDMVASLIEEGIRENHLRAVNAKAVACLLKAMLDGIEGLNALGYSMQVQEYLATGMDLVVQGLVKRDPNDVDNSLLSPQSSSPPPAPAKTPTDNTENPENLE